MYNVNTTERQKAIFSLFLEEYATAADITVPPRDPLAQKHPEAVVKAA